MSQMAMEPSHRHPHPPHFQIYQDQNGPPNAFAAMMKPRPQLQPSAMPLQPISNPAHQTEVILQPPMSAPFEPSPLKIPPSPSPPKPYNNLNYVPVPPPTNANIFTDSPVKKPLMHAPRAYCPPMSQQRPLFTTFNSNLEAFESDTFRPPTSRNDNFVDFPEPQYARKQPLKRSYSESTPMNDRPFKKAKEEETPLTHLPEPEDMPNVEDDGTKPTFSYAQMIGMAILRAPHRRLTLSQIYEWIAKTFAFYRNDTKRGWHNSIRHNLSLNKAFKRQERPKSDVGKGSYWVIEEGNEMSFIKDKSRKGNGIANINLDPQSMQQATHVMAQPLAEALAPNPYLGTAARPQTAPALPELSSDATLPASDPALEEDESADLGIHSLPQGPESSPLQAIHSSPPVAVGEHRRSGSSPAHLFHHSSAAGRNRNATTMDDSGYFSSIESSVLRNNKSTVILTSEIDLEPARKTRGRAEEEIARIRSSSHDLTPSHRRFRSLGSPDILASSPLRPSPLSRLNPVTPSVVFKKPMRPPPSISPNSQLNMHRRAMKDFTNSPVKSLGLWGVELDTYSPAFKWPGSVSHGAFEDHFEVYSDTTGTAPATPGLGSSPLKRSMKRPTVGRANTTANILLDMTANNARLNGKTPIKGPFLKPTPRTYNLDSPEKGPHIHLPAFEPQDDLFDFGMFADENSDDGEGVDILKGFQKIGGVAAKARSPARKSQTPRPTLGSRSATTLF